MKFEIFRNTADREFLSLRVNLLAKAAIRIPIILLLVSVLVCFELKNSVPTNKLIFWVVIVQVAAISRAIFAYWVLKRGANFFDPLVIYGIFVILAGLNGAAVGVSATLFFPTTSLSQHALIAMVLTGLVAGGVATSGSAPAVLASYSLAALLPMAVSWSIYASDQTQLVLWSVMIFTLAMVMYAGAGKRVLNESFLIRRQRDEAYRTLQAKTEEIANANAAIEKLAKTKTRVLAAASHDLRQPLHALSVYSAVLSANPKQDTLAEIGYNIDQLVRSLGALLDSMLDLSQLEDHSFPMQTSDACLAKISKKVTQEFEHSISAKCLILNLDLLPAPVISDPLILERIIRNLIDNAVKYTHSGFIRIETNVIDDASVFTLTDSGIGIPRDQLDNIFEEFFQIDNPGRDRNQGLGLGLSIVKKMVSLVDADLSINSTLAAGTTVSLKLPHRPMRQQNDIRSGWCGILLNTKTVLLIDDEASIIASMSALLKLWGAKVCTAADMESALLVAKRASSIDLIIADLRLKNGESGVDVVNRLREIWDSVPALIISGETLSERLSQAKEAGLTVLQKPIPPDLLFTKIANEIDAEKISPATQKGI
jgi:two-component system, sensor histidine kinase